MIAWTLGILGLLVFLFVLLSPLESLRWWADRGEKEVRHTFELVEPDDPPDDTFEYYVVYLSGVGTIGGDDLSRRELAWLDSIREALPEAQVIGDVFPYAVDNRGLLQRATEWAWSRLDRLRRRTSLALLPWLIEIRNVAQVLVSADPRYGPTYNIGLAQELWRSLQRHGYTPGSGKPVYLIGFSGGAQVALGASWFLTSLRIPITLISVGGIYGDDPGLDRIDHVWHLCGSKDRLQHLGTIAFPGRWFTAPLSHYGRAKRDGRITKLRIGHMHHAGAQGYMGRRAVDDRGRSHAEVSRDAVVDIIRSPLPDARRRMLDRV